MDAFSTQVRQISQFPLLTSLAGGELALLQRGGLGGPYMSITVSDLVGWGLASGGDLRLASGEAIEWNGTLFPPVTLRAGPLGFGFSAPVSVSGNLDALGVSVAGQPVATHGWVQQSLNYLAANSVSSFNGRNGAVELCTDDITRAGGAPANNPVFTGLVVGPTNWNVALNDSTLVTSAWVQSVLCGYASLCSPAFTGSPTAPAPPAGDYSQRIANTQWTSDELVTLQAVLEGETASAIAGLNLSQYAPLASPQFTGIPTAPTAAQTVNSGQLATTAYVKAAVTAATVGVASFNGRTGTVTLAAADLAGAGGALLAAPAFTGNPTAPTQAPGTSNTTLATTGFVQAALAGIVSGVSSFNGRTGAVTLVTGDVTGVGGALLASPGFTGTPTAPTAAPGTNTTQIASTAFVAAAVSASTSGVASFNGRTGLVALQASDVSGVGGALLASPALTGTPTAPTAVPGTNTTQLATTGFVTAALTAVSGVTTFNGRAGAVTLTLADVTGVGAAPLASPIFTGVPAGPTAAPGTNTTQFATTGFVSAALAALPVNVASFNGRTGAVTFQASDVSGVGGALLASPALTGTPTAPTATAGTNTTAIATTAFVAAAVSGITPPAASTTVPLVASGTGAVGTSTNYARADHVHPAAAGGATGSVVSINLYSSSQTITIPAGAGSCLIQMWGATGGSAGNGTSRMSGATGAGGYLESYLTGITAGNTIVYTQGAAGAAGAVTASGGNATATTLASGTQTIATLTANGSNGSIYSTSNGASTVGGAASGGNIVNVTGQTGGTADAGTAAGTPGCGGRNFYSAGADGVAAGASTVAGLAGNPGGLKITWYHA